MKTKTDFFLFLLITGSILSLKAQSYETLAKFKKVDNASCVAIDVNAPKDIAIQSLYDLLKNSESLKGKKSGDNLTFEKVVFTKISTDYINLYAAVSVKDNNNSTIYIFINKGVNSDYLSSKTDSSLIDKLKAYLDSIYAPVAAKANLNAKIDAQNKLIKDSNKNLSKLQSDFEKKTKQRDELNKDLEDLTKQIASQKTLIEQQNADLSKIK